jgi:hypothetical protein
MPDDIGCEFKSVPEDLIPLTEKDIKSFLLTTLRGWYKIKIEHKDPEVQKMAEYYVDAFQHMSLSLLGYMIDMKE